MSDPVELLKKQYKIEKELGQGGFGKTYLAIDTQHSSRKVVVKQFLPSRPYDDKMMARLREWFNNEAKLLRQLGRGCRLVPQRYDFFEEDGKVYIVQEFIEGSDLNSSIGRDKVLSEKDTIEIIKNILIGLEFVHQKDIKHLDLKPANLRVRKVNDEENEIVLLDFGIAREIQDELESLSEVIVAGSRDYMPPEQKAGKPILASDIYPIGIIGLQAITGLGISKIRDLEHGNIRLKDGKISPDAKIQASPQLIRFLSKTLAEDPQKRFANAMEALKALEDLYETEIELPPTDVEVPLPTAAEGLPSTAVETLPLNLPGNQPTNVVSPPDRNNSVAASTVIEGKPVDQLASTVIVDDNKPPILPPTHPNSPKNRWLMPLGAIAIAGGLGIAGWMAWTMTKESEWRTYPISKYGMQLSYPQTWTIEPKEPEFDMGSLAILYPPDQKSECGDKIAIETVEAQNPAPNLDKQKSDTIDRIKKSNQKVELSDETTIDTRLSQFPAFRLNYQREDSRCGSRQIIEVGTISNGRVYSVLYIANPQTASSNRSTFDKLVDRLKLD